MEKYKNSIDTSIVQCQNIVVGGGISGKLLCFYLRQKFPSESIVNICSSNLVYPCSLRTTGLVSLSGITKDVSPLGDMLFDAYHSFVEFFEQNKPDGIIKAQHLWTERDDIDGQGKIKRRFGKINNYTSFKTLKFSEKLIGQVMNSFLVLPEKFLTWLDQNSPRIVRINGFVSKVERKNEIRLTLNDGAEYVGKRVFWATGHGTDLIKELLPSLESYGSVVQSYYFKKSMDLGDESFCFALKSESFIYRATEKTLLIGGTSQKEELLAPDLEKNKKLLEHFGSILKLPNLHKDWTLMDGRRHKGKSRKPFWGKIAANEYAIFGLYKNGWSYPFLGIPEILNKLK